MSALKISIATEKGGEGKTATVEALGGVAASTGRKVLMVDMDPEAHLTLHFFGENGTPEGTTWDAFFRRKLSISHICENLDIIPADIDLYDVEAKMEGPEDQLILRNIIKKVDDKYDVIIFDCPPSKSWLTISAMAASDILVLPMSMDSKALKGVAEIAESYVQLMAKPLAVRILLNRYIPGRKINKIIEPKVRARFGSIILNTRIRMCAKLSECGEKHQDIYSYAPLSRAAVDYMALFNELLEIYEKVSNTLTTV